MRTIGLAVSASFLSGCAFAPPGAYPIFEPDPSVFAEFKATHGGNPLNFDDDENQGMLAGLRAQRSAYQNKADHAVRGTYNQSDWSTGGAAIGITGGLIENVATAVTGAVIGGGAAVVGSRYRQGEQITVYRAAATKTGCLVAVATDAMSSRYYDSEIESVTMAYRRPIARGANFAVMDILAGVRSQLDTLTPAAADFQGVLTQINQYRALGSAKSTAADEAKKFNQSGQRNLMAALQGLDSADQKDQATKAFEDAAAADAALVVADLQGCAKTGKPAKELLAAADTPAR